MLLSYMQSRVRGLLSRESDLAMLDHPTKTDCERSLDPSTTSPLPKDLAPELWLRVASNLTEEEILPLLALNRTFLGLALEIKYRTVDIQIKSPYPDTLPPLGPTMKHIRDSPFDLYPHVKRLVLYDAISNPSNSILYSLAADFLSFSMSPTTPFMSMTMLVVCWLLGSLFIGFRPSESLLGRFLQYVTGFAAIVYASKNLVSAMNCLVPNVTDLVLFIYHRGISTPHKQDFGEFFSRFKSVTTLEVRTADSYDSPSNIPRASVHKTLKTVSSGFQHTLTELHLPIIRTTIPRVILLENIFGLSPLESLHIEFSMPLFSGKDRNAEVVRTLASFINSFRASLRKLHLYIDEAYALQLFGLLTDFLLLDTLEVVFSLATTSPETIPTYLSFLRRHEATLENLLVPTATFPSPDAYGLGIDQSGFVLPKKMLKRLGFSSGPTVVGKTIMKIPSSKDQLLRYSRVFEPDVVVIDVTSWLFVGLPLLDHKWLEGFYITRLHLRSCGQLRVEEALVFNIAQLASLVSLTIDVHYVSTSEADVSFLKYPAHDALDPMSQKFRDILKPYSYPSHPLRELDIRRLPLMHFTDSGAWSREYPCICSSFRLWGLMRLFVPCFPSITTIGGLPLHDAPASGEVRICFRCHEKRRR